MNNFYLSLLLTILISGCASNPPVIQERTWHPVTCPAGNNTETFQYYREDNKTIRHGIYVFKQEDDDGKTVYLSTGAYVNGLREGLWITEDKYKKDYTFFINGKFTSTDTYNLRNEKIASYRRVGEPIPGGCEPDSYLVEGTIWNMGEDDHGKGKKGKITTYGKDNLIKTEDCDENGYIVAVKSSITLKDNIAYLKGEAIPFTGVFVTYHPNNEFDTKKYYKDGVPTGKAEFFNPDGTLKSVTIEKIVNEKGNVPSKIISTDNEEE